MGNIEHVRLSRQLPKPVRVSEDVFVSVAFQAFASESLVIVQSFWREGLNDVVAGKFINAFFNYYFILEGLYADGKTKNRAIEEKFKTSPELRSFIEQYLNDTHPHGYMDQVGAMLLKAHPKIERKLEVLMNTDLYIELLVSIRGNLHHFSNNPNRAQGSPLSHNQYEGIAMFAQYIAHRALLGAASRVNKIGFRETRI